MRWLFLGLALLLACGDDSDSADAGSDTGTDAPGEDAPSDSGTDAESDAGVDVGADDAGADAFDAGPLDPVDPFDGIGDVELVAESHEDVNFRFLEGPHWRPDGTLVFSDLSFGAEDNATIYALTPPNAIAIVRRPSGGANGNATDRAGNLVSCLQGERTIVRGTDTAMLVFGGFMGDRFNAPNDIVFRSDGTFYFTDPGYGVPMGDQDLAYRGVFRVSSAGILSAEYTAAESRRPNGIVISPDETVLYVADTEVEVVRRFDINGDGSLGEASTWLTGIGGADGMAVDVTGNVYVTSSSGVQVFNPDDGTSWGTIAVPRTPANCAFGDDDKQTLYITAREGLYRVRLPVAGL